MTIEGSEALEDTAVQEHCRRLTKDVDSQPLQCVLGALLRRLHFRLFIRALYLCQIAQVKFSKFFARVGGEEKLASAGHYGLARLYRYREHSLEALGPNEIVLKDKLDPFVSRKLHTPVPV